MSIICYLFTNDGVKMEYEEKIVRIQNGIKGETWMDWKVLILPKMFQCKSVIIRFESKKKRNQISLRLIDFLRQNPFQS